jgi:hypothetical protein
LPEKINSKRITASGDILAVMESTPQSHRLPETGPRHRLCGNVRLGNRPRGYTHKPFDPGNNYEIIYHAPPRAVIQIVEPSNARSFWKHGNAAGDAGQR